MKLKQLPHQINRMPHKTPFEDQSDDKEEDEQEHSKAQQHQEEEQHPIQLEDNEANLDAVEARSSEVGQEPDCHIHAQSCRGKKSSHPSSSTEFD